MHQFSVVEQGSGPGIIKFKGPYPDTTLQQHIKKITSELGAVYKCWEREGYGFDYCEWFTLGDQNFTFTLACAEWSIEANIEVIDKIEKALIFSKLFQKVPSES